ncbi:MAG: hypothetical protein QXI19_10295, partial [Candidatus Caldarchaeum sp.]
LRRPKSASETTREYAIAFAEVFQDGKAVIEVAEMFDEAFYAQIEPTDEQILSLKQKLRDFRKRRRGGSL